MSSAEYMRLIFYPKNKERVNATRREKYRINSEYREKALLHSKNYRLNNPKLVAIQNKSWRNKNREYKSKLDKLYRITNSEKIKITRKRKLIEYIPGPDMSRLQYKMLLRSWSLNIRDRDLNQCQICGSTNNIHAHHILHKKTNKKLQFNLNNGITLCKKCHAEAHGVRYNV